MRNPNFYIVSASVIPVFFLALTLQGKQFDDAEHSMRKLTRSIKGHLDQVEKCVMAKKGVFRSYLRLLKAVFAFLLLWSIASALLLVSVLGEAFALLVLYQGKVDPGDQEIVLIAVLSLTIGVGLLLYVRLQILQGANMLVFIRWGVRFVKLLVMTARGDTQESGTPHTEDAQDRHVGD